MSKKITVAGKQNIWSNSQNVDEEDLILEQNYVNGRLGSLINNHLGSGIILDGLSPGVLFNSSIFVGNLDGVGILAQAQPSDADLGNQLEVSINNSNAAGKKKIKVAIIGLDFESNLQYETFTFGRNEKQISIKHFTKILLVLVNDMLGDPTKSMNLGGNLLIKEASPLSLSRSAIMISQDNDPNIFFRDFYVQSYSSLNALLVASLPLYNVANLNINISDYNTVPILVNDIGTQLGQKFKARTNNIQKITLLMGVRNTDEGNESDLAWTGDIIISLYPLQTDINCITDIAPNTSIDFQPSNIPLAQLSINYNTLLARGILLNEVPQPVDFYFSDTSIANGNTIIPGNYYTIAAKRSGAANKCDILFYSGNQSVSDLLFTTFNNILWVDLPDQNLWFQVWTDAAKVSDGQLYENGVGLAINKTEVVSGITKDFCLNGISFSGTDLFKAVVQEQLLKSDVTQDQKTGVRVLSHQEAVPSIKLLSSLQYAVLENSYDPLYIGIITDKNKKFTDNSSFDFKINQWAIINDEIYIKVLEESTDPRYDTSVNSLMSSVLNGDLIGAKITPNSESLGLTYRVAKSEVISAIYGDLNNDGVVDEQDLLEFENFISLDLETSPPVASQISTDTITTTYTNGYNYYVNNYQNTNSITFQIINKTTGTVLAAGIDGILVQNPIDSSLANFNSSSVLFSSITDISNCVLVILDASPTANAGGSKITGLNTLTNTITVKKIILNSSNILKAFCADVNNDFIIDSQDGYYLTSYILHEPIAVSATSGALARIGNRFNVIKIKLEKFVDRADDYTNSVNRYATIHPLQPLFVNDVNLQNRDYFTSQVQAIVEKQFSWNEELISVEFDNRKVLTTFSELNSASLISCDLLGRDINSYPTLPSFSTGKNTYYVPSDLLIGGNLKTKDGLDYKVDFETAVVTLEMPIGLLNEEKSFNFFENFVANFDGKGYTKLGYEAMRFADCSFVSLSALLNNQVKFSTAIQSSSPEIDGYTLDGYDGIIVDNRIGVYINNLTGMINIHITNLYEDPTLQSLSAKIIITVSMKKSGFNNKDLFISSDKMKNILS